ncbi:YceD family protein [Aestuariirhabdus sp. Z084]|uniref:YceD family protein n=1 Tax=Aestuariirhabdus haliotis TaxID=2918751 RepID=UPI00201B36FE|nr:YceD family protein [Aestuariirhabdus haliotis]MCL6414798.1 YceD family protein [Aestuariirhabdus haliotis]MCL6418730.1 YceD family protein [Aestuariirhabdus haliotis]
MLTETLPKKIDPRKLARKGAKLAGTIELGDLKRLQDYVAESQGAITALLEFFRDEQGFFVIDAKMSAPVAMICQRCLEAVNLNVEGECQLAVVWTEDDAKSLPKHYEPVVVGEEELETASLIEEELILALPLVPYHREDECKSSKGYSTGEFAEEAEDNGKPNPFSVLANLKSDN